MREHPLSGLLAWSAFLIVVGLVYWLVPLQG